MDVMKVVLRQAMVYIHRIAAAENLVQQLDLDESFNLQVYFFLIHTIAAYLNLVIPAIENVRNNWVEAFPFLTFFFLATMEPPFVLFLVNNLFLIWTLLVGWFFVVSFVKAMMVPFVELLYFYQLSIFKVMRNMLFQPLIMPQM